MLTHLHLAFGELGKSQRQPFCTWFVKKQSRKCINYCFACFQGTLEKLDIQTETNNKLLAQQDKQQVSYTELNFNSSWSVFTNALLYSGHGKSAGTTGGP